ncbi:hypothetical protein [Methanosarcina siciliae]|uniref:hypothetical protein n=1 Tax=Methanosarcina siciliae TaxID=38027 RepID=UPI0018CCDCFC|nr:hypothetical protein [Methanosarcina siciliae]
MRSKPNEKPTKRCIRQSRVWQIGSLQKLFAVMKITDVYECKSCAGAGMQLL